MSITKEEIQAMSPKERAELLNTLWDVIEEGDYEDNLPAESKEHVNLLQESLEEYKLNPSGAKKWSDIYQELKDRKNAG